MPAHPADTESSVNERLPFSSLELEAHWQVDCKETLASLEKSIQQLINESKSIRSGQVEKIFPPFTPRLQKCAFIHNTKKTNRYSSCPDYLRIVKKTAIIQTAWPADHNQDMGISISLKNSLIDLQKMLTSEHCLN